MSEEGSSAPHEGDSSGPPVGETVIGIIVIRLIRSFPHRNIKHIVLRDTPRNITTAEFLSQLISEEIPKYPGLPPPFRKHNYDTLKISHQAHGAKTNDPVINKENDEELILQPGKSLGDCHIVNETELSLFNMEEYQRYKSDPTLQR